MNDGWPIFLAELGAGICAPALIAVAVALWKVAMAIHDIQIFMQSTQEFKVSTTAAMKKLGDRLNVHDALEASRMQTAVNSEAIVDGHQDLEPLLNVPRRRRDDH